jgi:hypothetical protein
LTTKADQHPGPAGGGAWPTARRPGRWLVVACILSLAALVLAPGAHAGTHASSRCPGAICITVDATQPVEPAQGQASGLLHSVYDYGPEISRLALLRTTMWRSSWYGPASNNVPRWSVAEDDDIPTTFVLSDKWWQDTHGGTITPWANWASYRSWVVSSVQQIRAAGIHVDYWEVFNEPDQVGKDYYPPQEAATVTPGRLLKQYLVTYQAIESVVPAAQVIGPSFAKWEESPTSTTFSMSQFLDFVSQNGINLAALSWHYNGGRPQDIGAQVAEARQLIAARPSIGSPKIFINEFGAEQLQRIPGWDVRYLAAVISAKVDSAGRSCWSTDCFTPVLDGLLAPNGNSPLPDYWVRVAYAQMSGTMVATTSTSANAAALASIDAVGSEIRVLIGYGSGCIQDPRCASSTPWALPAQSMPTSLSVRVPWTTGVVSVTETRFPGTAIVPISQPHSSPVGVLPITSSPDGPVVNVNVGLVADGDAWSVTLAHSG